MPLSDLRIRNLKSKEKPYKKVDFDGLYILINPTGSKLWRFKYRYNDKEKLISMGAYPAVTLQEARKRRDQAREQLAHGVDPSAQRQEQKVLKRQSNENGFDLVFDTNDLVIQ